LSREMATVYDVCAAPTQGFFLSWPRGGADGEDFRPSFLAERILRIFPSALFRKEEELKGRHRLASPIPALDAAAVRIGRGGGETLLSFLEQSEEFLAPAARIRRAAALRRGALSPSAVETLYGRKVRMSASRMDAFQSCHFFYFMRYGLRAKPRKQARFDAPEMGAFIHYVLEKTLSKAAKLGGVARVNGDWLRAACRESMLQYAQEELGGLENKTKRFRYLFRRLFQTVFLILENVAEELRVSDFQPISFELGFGDPGDLPPVELEVNGFTLSVSGFVDRVDGWEKDQKLYLRVVDYKTGRKKFDLTEIWNGMGMQLLLYLFALGQEGKLLYGKEVVPAGVLYLPARRVVLQGSRKMTKEEYRRKTDAELLRRGLLLNSPEVLSAMEHWEEGTIRFLPVKVNAKTGAVTGDALATAAQFEKLSHHLNRLLRQIAGELQTGNVNADPWHRGNGQSACLFCPFAGACQFDESCGDKKRYLPSVTNAEFWARLEEARPEKQD
ncbi:MAG: PD-(D/E)XK nuclease family protein, partial [Oscillospiraceae bacterium]|nr:PD-(D/E)XK nuclease family protein [Oscillospiraceae bacterium]